MVKDATNSAIRYIKNHYLDGFRQDAHDLFLGVYNVRQDSPFGQPLLPSSMILVILSGILCAFCFLVAMLTVLGYLINLDAKTKWLLQGLALLSVVFGFYTLVKHSKDFVSFPKLKNRRHLE